MLAINTLALLICVSVGLAQAGDKSEISFQLLRGYVVIVKGSIDGQSDLHFIVDTGAVPSVLDKRLMKHLKTVRPDRVSVFSKSVDLTLAEATNISVGPWQKATLPVLVSDLSFASDAEGVRIDGMLGLDFFGSSFSIDYRKKKLHRFVNGYQKSDDDLIINHSPEEWFATVDLKFGERTLKLLADSGTSDLVLFKSRVQDCIGRMKTIGTATWSNMGGEVAMQRVHLQSASIAGHQWSDREALLMDAAKAPQGLDGMLGLSSVRARQIVFLPPSGSAAVSLSQAAPHP